ncbi:putative A Receptor for Ubiquitination Targets [Lyophyllum shimeji]|uniref:A Receptor for Ubiquitination Targets n=1 Tax=Lyophyllum shimeji TaxID=47721 RepID=A0A9P3PEU7_LYOSH|nr:putative A Receptor for Ubiquitination Targets [Lyophyllum shimeji]
MAGTYLADEGYIESDGEPSTATVSSNQGILDMNSVDEREELVYRLLASLPRSRLAAVQKRIAGHLQFDIIGRLPAEISLQIFSHLTAVTLLQCALVNRRWQTLANDQSLWMKLCRARNWEWRQPSRIHPFDSPLIHHGAGEANDSDDEGMGDSDEDGDGNGDSELIINDVEAAKAELTLMQAELDSGFASTSFTGPPVLDPTPLTSGTRYTIYPKGSPGRSRLKAYARHSAPPVLKTLGSTSYITPDYKLLYQTHMKLYNRFLSSSYRLSALQTRGAPSNAHTNTIYCLQLYTYPSGIQVLFTGSRDRTVREWNLTTGLVERVIGGVHSGSVLSICVHGGYLASAGSDRRVAVWDLEKNKLFKVLSDHLDSVLCVRFDEERLVSCSKDHTVRTYSFPDLTPQFVLYAHRAAVNAVSISKNLIASGSGDKSIKLWDAKTGKLLRTFDNHHSRGIASIDFRPPHILTGSSDKHLRLVNMNNLQQGWSTSPEYRYDSHAPPPDVDPLPFPSVAAVLSGSRLMCHVCGSENVHPVPPSVHGPCVHADLVRSVVLGEDFVVSGSYDLSIKVWDRKTGGMIADLTGGHTARIFCIGFDRTKIVSCGEDQRICIWDFSHGIDTSFLHLS